VAKFVEGKRDRRAKAFETARRQPANEETVSRAAVLGRESPICGGNR
jgi:hypothetical protein